MKTTLALLSLTLLVGLSSCRKYDKNAKTNVGFYIISSTQATNTERPYRLFVDNVYRGDLNVSNTELTCGSDKLFYFTIDGMEHQIDLKDADGRLLSAHYLQMDENSLRSGTSTDRQKEVEGINGSSVRSTNDGCTVFSFTLD